MELLVNEAEQRFHFEQNDRRISQLEDKAREMEESIRYAGSIQQSILPNTRVFQNTFEDAFVLFKPKDIVSGDFYWFYQHGNDIYFAVGDCTGHGVPGALVNIAGNTILRQLIRLEGLTDPSKIIQLLDQEIVGLFNENLTRGQTLDGMDIVFCRFNLASMTGSVCCAGRPLILVRNGELFEYKKCASSVGYSDEQKRFESVDIALEEGDQFYLFSDGYTDQFGGENVKKFNRSRFRNLLASLNAKSMDAQKKELELTHDNWRGKQEQIDDICVIGVQL